MGYILTPTQAENDNKLINNTLESLKTTNLLKQSQDTTINPNLSTQNTQTTQSLQLPPKLPQGKIPQINTDSTKNTQNPQHSNTQKNIGFDSNVLSTQNIAKPLPQNDMSGNNTQTTQKPFNTQIALSSDKDFKPQSEMPQQTQIPQIQTPPKKSRLQREIESTKYATNFNQSAYTRNTTAFLGKPHEFSNHKLAMAAKLRLLENFDNNANIDDEVFQRYNIIDNAVAALETAKKIHGENSKAYKDILDQYMQYGILKDNGIKDYASLAEFYNKGGNVGIKTEFKGSENKESGLDSVDVDNTKKDETDKKKRNIAEFMTDLKGFHTKDQEKEQKDKGFIDKSTDWLSNTYKFDNKDNLQKQIDNGFSASEGFNILLNGDLDKRKEEYIKKHKLDEKTTLFGEKLDSDSYFANVINPANKYYEGTADFLTFGATSLLEKSEQDLRDFFDYMDMATSVSEGANKSFNEFREKYYDSLMEDNPTKKAQLKEQAFNKLKEAQEKYEKSPAKVYADSSLDRIAETIKHESDYGRIYTFLQDENIQKEKKQQFLSDFANVLKTDERYKDLDSLAFTKDNTLIAIMNEKEGQKAYAINPTLMSSILYTLYAAKSEIIGGIAGGAYGAAKGAKYGKAAGGVGTAIGAGAGALYGSMIGTAIGALTDSQVNRIVTGYLNSDLGAKKAIEAGVLDLAGNLALMGIAKGVSKGQEVFSNLNADSLKEGVNNLKDKAMLLSNGNVNAVTNFLAKNALDNNEREAIKEAAQKEFLNGKSLADYKSDSSIPKLERLKNAWQYEKFINKESMAKGKDKLEALSKEFESFQTTSMESNRPIMSLMQDMFEGKATRHEREKFLRFVSQNEALQSALSGVLAKNPTLALNFGQFIDKRAAQVAKSIESEALTQRMFKDMDSSYAKGLKDRYGKVEYDIKRTLDNINFSSTGTKIADILMDLKESIPHVTNAGQTINAMLQKLEARGIKSFEYDMFEYIEPNLNIDDLLNIRKYYNDILRSKDFKNASFKHLQAINKEIDSAVENALQDIAQQSGINTAKLLKNYKDINKEYADYAKFKESDFYKDSVKTKKREKDLSEDSFNKAILKQAQREEGFNNKVFNRIANNTDTNLQAQAIKELIQRNIANGNGQFRAVKWQELIQDLEKIEHSITDEGLKNLVSNLKQAQRLYNGDNEFLQAIQRSVGSKPANVLISSANGLFGRTLLLFYNFVHKIMARFAGALSENLAHQSLEDQLGKALRYARDTKDFIHVSIDSISKNLPKEDKETSKVLKELEYWKAQFEKDDIASFYTIKDAQETQIAITAHKQELQERKEVIDNALSEARKDIETIQKEVIESNPNFMPTRQIDDFDNEATYRMEVEFDKLGMQEFQRKIESGEIQLDKPTQKTLENAYSQYNHLLQKRELLEKDLQSFKAFDDNNILKTNSTLIAQTQRVLNQIQDDISFTKEAIKDIESELSTSNKALMPLNTHAETKKEIHAFSNLLIPTQTQTKPSFATNLMKQDTQGLIPYNSTQANNALIPYNTPQDTKLLAYNETKLLEYKETLHALQKLDKSFKDFMSMPFSIIVDSKGNALPLTSQAIKNFIFHNLYKEFMSATKALNKPLAQLDFKPLSNEIKALPYKANANLKAHLRDINAKTNDFLDSMQEFKNTTKEIKLLPYNKPSENKAVEVDRFRNVLGEMQSKNNIVSINADDALQRLYSIQGAKIPQELDIKSFMNTLDSIVNKDNFIAHLQKKNDSQNRLAYLNLVEPTLNKWDLKLTSGDRTDLIKVFNDGKNFFTLLITAENNKRLITFLPKAREDYIANKIKNADHIQTFISRASNENEWTRNANPTTKQEISKEIESKDIQSIEKPKEKTQIETLANMPHHPDDIKQIENLKAERQSLYDELAEIFDRGERQYFLNDVGTWYHTEEEALKRFNEIKQDLREGKGIRDVSSNTFNKNEYVTKVRQADVLNIEIDYLQIPRGLRQKYPKVDKWLMGVLDNYTRKPEVFKERFGDVESFFEDAASSSIEKALNLYPVNMIGGIGKKMGYDYAVKDKTFKKRLGELEYHREQIEALLDITPIAEFGKNYAEFYRKGQEAIQKLMAEKQGQVAGAFHRKELGDIDLVWGQVEGKGKEAKGYGLAKIIEKHGDEFEDIAKELDKIIQDGEVVKTHNGYNITLGDYKVGLNIGWNENGIKIGENKWVVTAFDNSKLQSEKQGRNSVSFTKGETLPLNSNAIIPQTPQEIIKQAKASGKSVTETKELLQKHKDIESKRKETQKLITQEKATKEKLHKEIGIFEKEKQNALEKLESIKTQINELEKKDLSSKQAQKQMDKLQTNLSFFANEIEKTRNLIKQRKDKLATTQEVYIPQNHTFSYDGREFNTREHFSILKQRSLNNQDDDFNGFDTLMREAIENALNIKPIKEFGTNYAEHYHSGETAIQKLISEAQAHKESGAKGEYKGQVAGAFHRKELGDIDLVWGQVEGKGKEAKGWGLAKIIEKHGDEFKDIAKEIDNIIQDGEVVKRQGRDEAYNIEYNGFKVGINKGFNKQGENKWIVTAFDDNIEKTAKTAPANDSTKGASLPLNSKDIIPQQTPKETQDSATQTIENFKKEFNIHDEAFKPTGHVRDNTKTGELEVLDTLNEYRPILNKDTYKKDGYYVISNQHNDLELLDFNGFNLGKVYHKKYDGQHRLFNIQDLELLENVSKDFLLLNGNKALEQAKKLAQSKTKKGVYIDYFNEMQDPIKSINKATTKDGIEIYTLNTQKFKQKEPLTNLTADATQLSQRTSQETKEIILNHILENDKLLYLLKQGINTQHLSPFQKEVLESVLDIANNPTKYKAYKLQGLQKQLNNLNESEAHLKTLGNYDKARYAKDRQELEREIATLKGETSLESATQKADSNDIIFTDKKGKEHTLTKEVQQQWLDTFNLKSLDDSYMPKHSDEIREALGGKEIKLQLGSLKKLVAQGREKYIPQIKEVLDSPEAIMRDDMGEYLFIKHLKDDDYFVNVSFDNGEYLVSISNGIKETRNLNNKLEKGGSFIYQSPNFNSISQKLLQTSQYSANKIDSDIIPQQTLNGDSITNPDISYAIKNENIPKELAEKIANNGEIANITKRDDFNKADIHYYDKDNMTMYSANIGNYIDDDLGMKGDRFFLNNINKNEFYIPPTKSLQDFKEQSLNQIEFLKKAIKTEIDNVRDEKELHKNIREIKFKARENAEKRLFDDALYKEQTQAREFYTTQYDEAMQEMKNYYDKKFTNTLNEIDFNAPTKQAKTQMPKDNPQLVAFIPQTTQEIIKQAKASGKSVKETKELLQKHKDNKIINTLKDMQDKDLNTKLGDKDLLNLYASASRDIVQNMENASFELDFIHQIKQYNDNLFAFFEKNPQFKELSLFKNFYNHLQNIIRKKQIENFTKPLNSKTEISTKSGNIYYFDEKHNLLKNPQEKPIKKDEIVLNEKGDTLLLSDTHLVLTNKNKDFKDRYIDLLTNSDKREVLQFANFFQNGLTLENKKLFDLFKSIPKAAFMKYPLEILMQIFNDIVPNNKATIPFYAEFAKKHYGSVDNFNKDFLQKMDRQYKENGNPFGILFNDEVTIKEFGKEYFKGKNAVDFLLYTQAGHIENAFYKEGLGGIDLVWGEVTGKGKEAKGWGLAKIIEKHLNAGDFKAFGEGKAGLINAMSEIIDKGKVITQNGVDSIILRKNGEEYRIGISKGWDNVGENKWIITSYKNNKYKESAETSYHDTFTSKEPLENLATNIIPQTTQEIIKQAKASGKSVAETKELLQKNKGLQQHNNTESTPAIDNTHSNKELKSSIKENIESTPQKHYHPNLKDELKAADNTQKVAIVTRELEKQNEVLLKQYKELQDIVKNKDYTSLEIQEALDYIATNKKFETDTSIVVYNPIDSKDRGVYITKAAPQDERAKQFLKWKYTHLEQKPLMDIIKKNKSDISKLKWDLEFIKNESNKMRLEKNLARLEKSLLKEEQEYLKSLSLTYDLNTQEGLQKTKDLFYRAKPTQEQIELFESILPVAKKLGVEVRNAIRDPYQVGGNTKNKSGTYFLKENSARVKHSISQADKSETLLHELIHSVTSRAMYAKEKGATHLLNKEQIQAIDNIESIYKQIVEKKDELGFKSWNAREKTGDYGLKNSHEMIAELSNPKFANKLKKANVFEKIIDNIIQLFVSVAEMAGLKKSNAYDKLRENVKNIIENYKDDFSQEYEKLGVRNVGLELFAGEKALVNESYAPHKARLEKAKELESSGADEIEIWEKTGWYKDKDKKWKFEISQSGGELDFSGLEFYTFSRDNRVKLSRILKDDELFTAYPSLKNLIVNFDYGMNDYNLGSYAKYTKEITLNAKQLRDNQSRLSALYHEIQHAIQDIEDFGFGYKEAENLRGISQESVERYAKQHGEVEARNVQKRLNSYGNIHSKQSLKDEIQKLKDVRLSLQKSDPDLAEVFDRRIKEYEKNYKNLGEHDIYNTRKHPHKTMDTNIKDTIAEATMHGEALSRELESSFLDSSGRVDYKALMDNAEALPQTLNLKGFKDMIFKNDKTKRLDSKNAVVQTPAGEVKVNVLRAFNHYTKNGYKGKWGNGKENRQAINATFIPTLLQPKFVTRDKAGTLYYYKPFVSKDKEYHITSIAVKTDGTLDYATSYNATENRLNQMIKHNELVYMESGLS